MADSKGNLEKRRAAELARRQRADRLKKNDSKAQQPGSKQGGRDDRNNPRPRSDLRNDGDKNKQLSKQAELAKAQTEGARNRAAQTLKRQPPREERQGLGRLLFGKREIGGLVFWIMVAIAVALDIVDLLSLTVAGATVTFVTGLIGSVIFGLYFFVTGVSLRVQRMAARISLRMTIWLLSFVLESVPWVEILPSFTITLFVIRTIENRQFARAAVNVMAARSSK